MDEKWEAKVKKLALTYHTGWQYQPDSAEPGSVLTDIFLDMEWENEKRLKKIWEKHKRKFLGAVQEEGREKPWLLTALSVKAPAKADGAWLWEGTEVYTVLEEGGMVRFQTVSPAKLTAAKLRYAIYRDGFYAWLVYAGEENMPLKLFLPEGEEIARPRFSWDFPGLCDGMESFCFSVKFREISKDMPELKGEWGICCGETVIPATWQQDGETIALCGERKVTGSLPVQNPTPYELIFMAEGKLDTAWVTALYGGFVLEEEKSCFAPKFCLTEEGGCDAGQVLPFGRTVEEAACCYIVCDRAVAGRNGQVTLCFTERYGREEKLPPPVSAEYKKIYKKYPWMKPAEEILDWKPAESVWEYFNGDFWCALPEARTWETGCHPEQEGEKEYHFNRPEDMVPCVVQGQEHYYIRLRLAHVKNAYATYYNKDIPVLEKIHFVADSRQLIAAGSRLFPKEWAGEQKMYLGFDREIDQEQRWYTGTKVRSFLQEQIKGFGSRFGREAFWVELPSGDPEIFGGFFQNYVEIRQVVSEEEEEKATGNIAAGSMFYAQTKEFGVLEAVSLLEASCGTKIVQFSNRKGKPRSGKGNYFTHCGRVVTQADLKIFMQEKYPQFCLVSCGFSEDQKEFFADVCGDAEVEGVLAEMEEWLAGLLSRVGGIWFQGVRVKCRLV